MHVPSVVGTEDMGLKTLKGKASGGTEPSKSHRNSDKTCLLTVTVSQWDRTESKAFIRLTLDRSVSILKPSQFGSIKVNNYLMKEKDRVDP